MIKNRFLVLLSLVASVVAFSYVSANADEKKGYV